MSGLPETTVPIPIATLNQTPSPNSGPIGRLTDVENITVEHYIPDEGGPAMIKTVPRKAFVSLSTDTKNPKNGNASSGTWGNPEILASLGTQPVSVCNSVPRIYNGEDAFIDYDDKRVVVSTLTQEIFHTTDKTLQVSDPAWIQGVTCSVWTETTLVGGIPRTVSMVGFKNDDQAWIVTPRVLFDPGNTISDNVCMARVCKDGDGERFWVVFNAIVDGDRELRIKTYDLNGKLIASESIDQFAEDPGPGYWDIQSRQEGGIFIAQPAAEPDGVTDVHVQTTSAELDGLSIDIAQDTDATIHCSGPLGYITNDVDTLNYLATYLSGSGKYVYQMTELTKTHQFTASSDTAVPDSFIGWIVAHATINPDPPPDFFQEPTVFLGWSVLSPGTTTVGPKWDPALRHSEVWSCTWSGLGVKTRQINSSCFVSRAFLHNGQYYALTYYQSGSGLSVTEVVAPVTWTAGDYMIGTAEQSVPVVAGDDTAGSVQVFPGTPPGAGVNIVTTVAITSKNIDGSGTADKVELADNPDPGYYGDASTQVLAWHLKNETALVPGVLGGQLIIATSSIPTANQTWDIVNIDAVNKIVYTSPISRSGGSVIPGSFTTVGTAVISPMTIYYIKTLADIYSNSTVSFISPNGTMTITGATGANNGVKTIYSVDPFAGSFDRIRIVTGSEFTQSASFIATISTSANQHWGFSTAGFSDVLADVPHKLLVAGANFTVNGIDYTNDGEFLITDDISATVLETDGVLFPQIFGGILPTVKILLPIDVTQYTFKLQSLTLDYTFNNALVSVQDATNAANNGLYRITFVNPAEGTFVAEPADGRIGQLSESFPSDVTITIFFNNAIQPVFQPKWFMTPLENVDTAQVGRFDDGSAFADWRFEGDPDFPANMFLMGISSVAFRTLGKQFVLPYRAKSFTAGQPLVAPNDVIVPDAATTVFESTVGLKTFILNNAPGTAVETTNELIFPGPMTSMFTQSGFNEQGISVSPEAPFMVTQGEVSDGVSITPGTQHQYVFQFKVTLQNGDTVYCLPSKALDVRLSGDNNFNTIGCRLPIPLGTDGNLADATHKGLTNYPMISMIVTRTAIRGGVPTIQHFEITDPLNVNALAPISTQNESGFSFPDEYTVYYKDANPDVSILSKEILYTDKGNLPRFPAKPSIAGCVWLDRDFLVCDDGSLQMSGAKTEGDASWFFPAFRFTFGNDRAVNCQPFGNYLIVGCRRSMWYIPAPNSFPDAGGRNGRLPDPVLIEDCTDGCSGLMKQIDGAVAYASTAGGLWAVTSNFKRVFLSEDIKDNLSLTADSPTSLAIDKFKRLHVATGSERWYVYDQVVRTWYKWKLPVPNATLNATIKSSGSDTGIVAWQDPNRIAVYSPSDVADDIDNEVSGIGWKLVFANFTFGNVRRFKHCWAFQVLGEYKGPHNTLVSLSYPQDDEPTTVFPLTAIVGNPYLYEFNPRREDASVFQVTIEVNFDGIDDPGESAEIECLAATVGLQSGMNQITRRL